jgi:hypothetical protein
MPQDFEEEGIKNGEMLSTNRDERSSENSCHSSRKSFEEEKSISAKSKMSVESESKIIDSKLKKFTWIEIYKNDFISLKKRVNIKKLTKDDKPQK